MSSNNFFGKNEQSYSPNNKRNGLNSENLLKNNLIPKQGRNTPKNTSKTDVFKKKKQTNLFRQNSYKFQKKNKSKNSNFDKKREEKLKNSEFLNNSSLTVKSSPNRNNYMISHKSISIKNKNRTNLLSQEPKYSKTPKKSHMKKMALKKNRKLKPKKVEYDSNNFLSQSEFHLINFSKEINFDNATSDIVKDVENNKVNEKNLSKELLNLKNNFPVQQNILELMQEIIDKNKIMVNKPNNLGNFQQEKFNDENKIFNLNEDVKFNEKNEKDWDFFNKLQISLNYNYTNSECFNSILNINQGFLIIINFNFIYQKYFKKRKLKKILVKKI